MDRPCDDGAADAVVDAFAFYGVTVDRRDDGSVATDVAGLARILDARCRAAVLRFEVPRADDARVRQLAGWVPPAVSDLLDVAGASGAARESLSAAEALQAVVALDLVARLDSLHEASDPVEELRFLVAAAESGSYGDLGPHVAAVAEAFAAHC